MRTAIALLTMLTVTFVAGETASVQQAGESNASENAELAKKLSNRHAAVGIDENWKVNGSDRGTRRILLPRK